ncbi:Uncharacterised protein [Bordetella pertussis]|nr:Uncharacterised protein [Bordetella pertussis]
MANSPSALRRPRIACSGRNSRGSVSYFQSPTAPNSTACEPCANSSVAGGKGCSNWSKAAPPTGAWRSSSGRSSALSTRSACSTISGPMPSPGRTAI